MQVTNYRVEYNIKLNQGSVAIELEDGSNGRLNVNSDAELIVALLLLNKVPVDFDAKSGAMTCGLRPVGT